MELFFQNFVSLEDLVKRDWSNLKPVLSFFIKQVVFEVALNQRFSRLWWTVHQKWIAYRVAVRFVTTHCMKSVQIRSFVWSVFSGIQSECGKIRTKKNSVFGQFFRSDKCLISTYLGRFDGEVCQECQKINMTII